MRKKLTFLFFFFSIILSRAQVCPKLTAPLDGETDISVTTDISWENLTGGQIFLISLGSTPGGADIINRKTSGVFANFTPPKGLPEKTRIYVSLEVIDGNSGRFSCEIGSFVTEDVTTVPSCTTLRDPLNNAIFVREEVNIVWNYAPLATGYRLSIGTTPGGSNVVDDLNVGNTLFYDPPVDLPVNAIVYVRIKPYNENGPATSICSEESFTMRTVSSSLACTKLTHPMDGALDVPKSLMLEWEPITLATGYKISVSTSPFDVDIFYTAFLDTNTTDILNLESTHKYWVTIVPFNDAGEAIGCTQESFTTEIDCGPFTDELTGETIILNPIITIPEQISLCNDQLPFELITEDIADGYRWFKINSNGSTDLISESIGLQLTEGGTYLFEAYDRIAIFGSIIECSTTQEFSVLLEGGPNITSATATNQAGNLMIVVRVEGTGQYEYSLTSSDGPFQDSNIFEGVPEQLYTVYVRNKDGCAVSKKLVQKDTSSDGFPKFFTPNGDGINDFWQYEQNSEIRKTALGPIAIFDRYGVLLLQIMPLSEGWDGTLNGRPLPASDYWFTAFVENGKHFKGHFALKR